MWITSTDPAIEGAPRDTRAQHVFSGFYEFDAQKELTVAPRRKRQLTGWTPKEKPVLHAIGPGALENKAAIDEAMSRIWDGRAWGLTGRSIVWCSMRPVEAMQGLREVGMPDPIGRILDERERPNGLLLQKITTPIGVVGMIYESRPNVTADAAGLCFKSGNATILRGGKEAIHSNQIIAELMVQAAQACEPHFPVDAIQVVPTTDRAAIPALLSLTDEVDLCMPRGGEGLIRAVAECSKVPVIKHYKGVCHVYIHGQANAKMAIDIAINAKTQRPGVCNAMETLLVDAAIAEKILPELGEALARHKVEVRGDEVSKKWLTPLMDQGELSFKWAQGGGLGSGVSGSDSSPQGRCQP